MSSNPSPFTSESAQKLKQMLNQRLKIIADHELRQRAPDEQLRQLQSISEQLQSFHIEQRAVLPQRLNHFLTQASYQKALEWLDEGTE